MNLSKAKAIGGYFSLELPLLNNEYHAGAVRLNSARNCLEYILEVEQPAKVYIPLYTCDVMLEPFNKTGIEFEFYRINENLEPLDLPELATDELFVYNNYFGIKDDYAGKLAKRYGQRLVVDASQSFYYRRTGAEKVFYSPRKFFGLPDGGLLYTDKKLERELDIDVSFERMSHLIKRIELPPEEGYDDFRANDEDLSGQPIRRMSLLTERLLQTVDHELIRRSRYDNFALLHKELGESNLLEISLPSGGVPMVYPYLIEDATGLRKALIDNRVFVASYWPNVFTWAQDGDLELSLARNIIPIPIDQRYDGADMERIIELIHEHTS